MNGIYEHVQVNTRTLALENVQRDTRLKEADQTVDDLGYVRFSVVPL